MAKKKSKKKAVKKVVTNAMFAETNEAFLTAVELVKTVNGMDKIQPTTRQASKWRNKKGVVYKHSKGML
jgi:hypothetical protein